MDNGFSFLIKIVNITTNIFNFIQGYKYGYV